MTEDDVKIDDAILTLNKQGGNLVTSADKVQYVTSDPQVAYVDEQGQVIGVSQGTVDLTAYVAWNGTLVKSTPVQVTVGDGADALVEISADATEFSAANATATLTYTDGATVSLVNPVTGEHPNHYGHRVLSGPVCMEEQRERFQHGVPQCAHCKSQPNHDRGYGQHTGQANLRCL